MTKTLTAAALAVLLMLLTACGGGSDSESSSDTSSSSATTSASGDEATAARSISDGLMSAQKSGDSSSQLLSVKREDADCIGSGLVDEVGTAQLQKYGMLTEDMKAGTNMSSLKMSKADAESMTGVVFSCTDVEAMIRTAISRTGTIPKQARGCVNDALNEQALRPVFSKIFQGKQTAAQQELTAPLLACARQARQ